VPWGRVMMRLHFGPYRVLYEIGETTIWVSRVDRVLQLGQLPAALTARRPGYPKAAGPRKPASCCAARSR